MVWKPWVYTRDTGAYLKMGLVQKRQQNALVLNPDCLGTNFGSTAHWLGNLGHVTSVSYKIRIIMVLTYKFDITHFFQSSRKYSYLSDRYPSFPNCALYSLIKNVTRKYGLKLSIVSPVYLEFYQSNTSVCVFWAWDQCWGRKMNSVESKLNLCSHALVCNYPGYII